MTAGSRETTESFDPELRSVRAARQFMRRSLDALDIPEPPLENAVLLGNELVTNAVKHAKTRFEVRLSASRTHVRVEVRDSDTSNAEPRAAAFDDTSGRGLSMVDRVADSWGIDQQSTGKAVWAELRL